MTLNITVAARWLMAQSSGFRLTSVENGKRVTKSHTAQKQVLLHYPDWSGLVCYTGVAKHRTPGFSRDTAAWLQKVLAHPANERRSPRDVVNLLINEGSVWLRKIPPEDRRHTFTMITYDQREKPHVWVISNYERPDQPDFPEPDEKPFFTPIRPRSHPRCIVTGWDQAVTKEQKTALTELLAHKPPRDQLSDAVALTNREASAKAEDTVSKECIVATLSPDGSGQIMVYGDLPEEFLPILILCGNDLSPNVSDAMTQQGLTNQMLDVLAGQKTNLAGGQCDDGLLISVNIGPQVARRSVRASPPKCSCHGHRAALTLIQFAGGLPYLAGIGLRNFSSLTGKPLSAAQPALR
jgi:hypothetical protein